MIEQQNPDGSWSPAQPIGPQGVVARIEFALRARGFKRISNLLGKFDERGLGR